MFSSTSPFSFFNFLQEIKGFSYLQVTQDPVKLNNYFMVTLPSFIYQSVPHLMRPCYRVEFRQVLLEGQRQAILKLEVTCDIHTPSPPTNMTTDDSNQVFSYCK